MKLVVGLGNPGRDFAGSRHNVGFDLLNFFARQQGISFSRRISKARIGMGKVEGEELILAKPRVFVNLSGEAVATLVQRFKVPLGELLVIYDDLDLPLGKIRIRRSGGAGGHKGVKSIVAELGSEEFPRLRVGIAPPDSYSGKIKTPEYVLGKFTSQEKGVLAEVYPWVAKAIYFFITQGIEATMNKFNSFPEPCWHTAWT